MSPSILCSPTPLSPSEAGDSALSCCYFRGPGHTHAGPDPMVSLSPVLSTSHPFPSFRHSRKHPLKGLLAPGHHPNPLLTSRLVQLFCICSHYPPPPTPATPGGVG